MMMIIKEAYLRDTFGKVLIWMAGWLAGCSFYLSGEQKEICILVWADPLPTLGMVQPGRNGILKVIGEKNVSLAPLPYKDAFPLLHYGWNSNGHVCFLDTARMVPLMLRLISKRTWNHFLLLRKNAHTLLEHQVRRQITHVWIFLGEWIQGPGSCIVCLKFGEKRNRCTMPGGVPAWNGEGDYCLWPKKCCFALISGQKPSIGLFCVLWNMETGRRIYQGSGKATASW